MGGVRGTAVSILQGTRKCPGWRVGVQTREEPGRGRSTEKQAQVRLGKGPLRFHFGEKTVSHTYMHTHTQHTHVPGREVQHGTVSPLSLLGIILNTMPWNKNRIRFKSHFKRNTM